MDHLKTGQFRGNTYQTVSFDGITATETEYDYKFIDWHYHDNPYFSLTTLGCCRESNRRETIECSADSLVFHNSQEPHYNVKSDALTRGFQIELDHEWRRRYELEADRMPTSAKILDPHVKLAFYNIYKESKLADETSPLTIDALLLQIFEQLCGVEKLSSSDKPRWVARLDELLHDDLEEALSLKKLSKELDLHWAHLSRDFPRYFRCNFGEYIRKIRVERSVALLRRPKLSLTEIAQMCGFADQSHFIRCFKQFNGITPKKFRRLIA